MTLEGSKSDPAWIVRPVVVIAGRQRSFRAELMLQFGDESTGNRGFRTRGSHRRHTGSRAGCSCRSSGSKSARTPVQTKLDKSQSGTKLLLVSVQAVTELTGVVIGLLAAAALAFIWPTYRPSEAFTAVRPVPNTSYEAPTRGSRSIHSGTSLTAAKLRSGIEPMASPGHVRRGRIR